METTKERGDESDTGMSTAQEETPAIITKTVSTLEFVDNKPVFKPGRDFLLAFIALCTLTLAVAFDATTLSVALPQISVALNGTALEAFWSGTSFLLATTVFQPTLASLSNIFGRKYVSLVCPQVPPIVSLTSPVRSLYTSAASCSQPVPS